MLTKQEVGRQILHVLLGIALVVLYYFNILTSFAVFLGIICGGLISFISKRTNIPIFNFFLKHYERKEDLKKFPGRGMIFYFIGVLLVMQLFSKDIALAAMMVLALGDAASHLYGAKFGKVKNIFNGDGRKLLEGTLAGAVAGFVGAVIFVPIPEAFLGSLAAMFIEVVKIDFNEKTLDDNLTVPLVAGTVMLLVRTFL
jgi:dolichol kinase